MAITRDSQVFQIHSCFFRWICSLMNVHAFEDRRRRYRTDITHMTGFATQNDDTQTILTKTQSVRVIPFQGPYSCKKYNTPVIKKGK